MGETLSDRVQETEARENPMGKASLIDDEESFCSL
jgi:hypothetical protein